MCGALGCDEFARCGGDFGCEEFDRRRIVCYQDKSGYAVCFSGLSVEERAQLADLLKKLERSQPQAGSLLGRLDHQELAPIDHARREGQFSQR